MSTGSVVFKQCRVCHGQEATRRGSVASFPIYLWPLKSKAESEFCDIAVFQCDKCQHLQLQHLEESFVMKLYSKGAFVQDNQAQISHRLDLLDKTLGKNFYQGQILLDIGGGQNPFFSQLNECERWVVDINENKEVAGSVEHYINGRFESSDLPENYFDYIFAFHILEHLSDPATAVVRMNRLLKKKGRVIVEVPNFSWAAEHLPYYALFHQHLNLYDVQSLDYLFVAHGLTKQCEITHDDVLFMIYEKASEGVVKHSDVSPGRDSVDLLMKRLDMLGSKLFEAVSPYGPKKMGLFGAGGSSTLLLAHFPFLKEKIACAFDSDPRKQGNVISGTDIRIYSPDQMTSLDLECMIFLFSGLHRQYFQHIDINSINVASMLE